MDVDRIAQELTAFLRRHQATIEEVSRRHYQFLEIGALTFVVEHYKKKKYVTQALGLKPGGIFHVKLGSQGAPSQYSWFRCRRGKSEHDIYLNLPVLGSYADGGVYVVDVGVVRAGVVPVKHDAGRPAVPNSALITFAEVKNFKIYPMLLAHFIGIIHELQPLCLGSRRPYGFARDDHFAPALFTIGNISPNATLILNGFLSRKFRINVIPAMDVRIATMSASVASASPLRS